MQTVSPPSECKQNGGGGRIVIQHVTRVILQIQVPDTSPGVMKELLHRFLPKRSGPSSPSASRWYTAHDDALEYSSLVSTVTATLVGWLSGRTSVSDRRTFTGLHRTCS